MQISIITPLFNRLDLTLACLESVKRTLPGWDYEWILIDDGSTDGTREFLQTLPKDNCFRVVLNEKSLGFAANNNLGARLARAPLLCLLNNDTALLPGWLEPMARVARLLPDVACVGNIQREPVSGLIDHCGIYFNAEGYAQHAGKNQSVPPREDYLEWPAVTAACCVIRRRLFLNLGGFDEAFRNGFEDVDFCLRAGTRGYRHFVANRSVIYHHVSASPGRKQNEEDNLCLFRARWLARLLTELRGRRTLQRQREEGRRYLRKHRWHPWRYNVWRFGQALEKVWTISPPSRRLDLLPRLLFRWQDFVCKQQFLKRAKVAKPAKADTPIFIVVGDTALTSDRSSVPTIVRNLAAAFGRTGASVKPVMWKAAANSLSLLPPELSVGLDAESLRGDIPMTLGEVSAASLCDSSMECYDNSYTDMPYLHELPSESAVPSGAWILLPEVLYQGRTKSLVDYVHRHGWRFAVTFHDAMPTNEPRFFPPGIPHEHDTYLRAIADADLIFPVSDYAAADWYQFAVAKGLRQPRLQVLTPGADTCSRTRSLHPTHRVPSLPIRMLCVSAITPRKNHRTLLAAFDLVATMRPELNLELCLVGAPRLFSNDNVPEAIWQAVQSHPGKVSWLEWVEYSALRKLYEDCDFTVFPSLQEGWGLPILESLWFGKLCICANFGAMVETAAGGGCLTVDVRDAQTLAEAIISLAGSPERLAALADEAHARLLNTWEQYASDLIVELRRADSK